MKIAIAVVISILIAGCATSGPMAGVCAVVPMQSNQQGVAYFRYVCEPEKEGK